jgi:hypothetical protein
MAPVAAALLLALASPARAEPPAAGAGEGTPTVESLPEVTTGEDAIKGDVFEVEGEKKAAAVEVKRTLKLRVTARGIVPPFFELKMGEPTKLVLLREVEGGCATRLEAKAIDLVAELPLRKEVEVIVTPRAAGNFVLSCPSGKTAAGFQVK